MTNRITPIATLKTDNWEQVVSQLIERLPGLDSTVILLIVDQSTTVISQSFNEVNIKGNHNTALSNESTSVKQIGNGNANVSDSERAKLKVTKKDYAIKQRENLNAVDSSDLDTHLGDKKLFNDTTISHE